MFFSYPGFAVRKPATRSHRKMKQRGRSPAKKRSKRSRKRRVSRDQNFRGTLADAVATILQSQKPFAKGRYSLLYRFEYDGTSYMVKSLQESSERAIEIDGHTLVKEIPLHEGRSRVYDILKIGGACHLILEFACCCELFHFITLDKPSELDLYLHEHEKFYFERKVTLLLQLAAAIQHLASHGLVHTDIGAENVMYNFNGTCKLIDYGFVCKAANCQKLFRKRGNPRTRAPELYGQQPDNISKCDVWSVAVLFWTLLYGDDIFIFEDGSDRSQSSTESKQAYHDDETFNVHYSERLFQHENVFRKSVKLGKDFFNTKTSLEKALYVQELSPINSKQYQFVKTIFSRCVVQPETRMNAADLRNFVAGYKRQLNEQIRLLHQTGYPVDELVQLLNDPENANAICEHLPDTIIPKVISKLDSNLDQLAASRALRNLAAHPTFGPKIWKTQSNQLTVKMKSLANDRDDKKVRKELIIMLQRIREHRAPSAQKRPLETGAASGT